MKFHLSCITKQYFADTETPVSIYLKLRDYFAETLLLEDSSIQHEGKDISYICCEPIAGFVVSDGKIKKTFPDGSVLVKNIDSESDIVEELNDYINNFSADHPDSPFSINGLYGYFCYDSVRYFENIPIADNSLAEKAIPDVRLNLYRYIIVLDHSRNEIHIVIYNYNKIDDSRGIEFIEKIIATKSTLNYSFKTNTPEFSNCTDEEFLSTVQQGIQHCHRGDVFQIVLSRSFHIGFLGDDFNVYRALRAINPSPYMFYFDYGSYRLFGSSPEVQLRIKGEQATVHPIAGTYKRTGDKRQDFLLAEALEKDKKENAEHVMLVDLARNDLSKHYKHIHIPVYKSIQFFSHVIHMVSEVTASTPIKESNSVSMLADTFPAGTLSGAPKYKAMELIDKLEKNSRGFYGGCIGYIGFDGDLNQAILIRSFLSKNNLLFYQAGAGVVAVSKPESELTEVNNKIAALRKAIEIANDF